MENIQSDRRSSSIYSNLDIDLNKFKKILSFLNDNYDMNLTKALKDENLEKAYNYIKKVSEATINTDGYNQIVQIIMKQFRPSEIESNTIGSFIFGCFQSTHGDIDANCSILCSNSIKNPYNESISTCQEQIWIQTSEYGSKRFVHLSSSTKTSMRAYAFLLHSFTGFTDDEINAFSDN